MKILKNRIFLVLLTAIVFTGIGIYAETLISADNVTYTDSNNNDISLSNALDSLYTTQSNVVSSIQTELNTYKSKFDVLTFNFSGYSYSSTKYGQGLINITNFRDKYTHFKVISKNGISNHPVSYCELFGYSTTQSTTNSIEINTEYNTQDYADVYARVLSQTDSTQGGCTVRIQFYN